MSAVFKIFNRLTRKSVIARIRQERNKGPHTSIVVANDTGSPLGRSQLEGIGGSRRGSNRDTESKDKTTSQKVGVSLGGGLYDGTDHDEDSTSHHTSTTSEVVANRASEERADHVTDGVNHENAAKEENTCEPGYPI